MPWKICTRNLFFFVDIELTTVAADLSVKNQNKKLFNPVPNLDLWYSPPKQRLTKTLGTWNP